MSNKIRQALCCTCGEIRTCRRPRNHRAENYWLSGPVDRNWHRELGDLKCTQCGKVTRHAIVRSEGDPLRDYDERITRIALGGSDPFTDAYPEHRDRVREAYRQGRQPNPYLNHMWRTSDEEAARKAGKTTIVTYCGEVETIPEKTRTHGGDQPLAPAPVRWEQEYEHPETGGWWVEMDCVDCRRVVNEQRAARRRKLLTRQLIEVLAHADRVPNEHVEKLLAAIEATRQGGGS